MKIVLGILIGSIDTPENAPAWLLKAVQSVQIQQGDGSGAGDLQQGFQMTFRAERSQGASHDYALLSSPLLNAGNRIILTVTLDTKPHVLFDGIIAHRQLSPGSASDTPSLTVMGKDISILMDLEEKDVVHTGLGDKEIVEKILRSYAGYGIVARAASPSRTWTPNEKERTPKQVATDRKYVQMLAERHSFAFQIRPGPTPKHSTGYWGPLEYDDTPQRALTVNSGAATNVEAFNIADDALAPMQVFGTVHKDNATAITPIDATRSSLSTSLAKTPRLTDDGSFVRKLRLVYSGANAAEAQALAQTITDRSTEQVLRVSGSLDTFRYGSVLRAPGKVSVRGAGYSYDGDYYVQQVTHTIGRGEYKQDFVLTREEPRHEDPDREGMMDFYGKYRGKVIDNKDPLKRGQLLTNVPAISDHDLTWAEPCTPYAGPRLGWYVMPPTGANVWIEFERGDVDYPIWTGCFWGIDEKDGLPPDAADPEIKVLQTEKMKLVLDDKAVKLTALVETDKGKMSLVMDKSGIVMTADTVTITVTPDKIELKKVPATIEITDTITLKKEPASITISNSIALKNAATTAELSQAAIDLKNGASSVSLSPATVSINNGALEVM